MRWGAVVAVVGVGVLDLEARVVLPDADDQQVGVNIIKRAIEEPMRWIASNAGEEGSIVVAKVRDMKADEGYNAATDTYEDLVKAGVIDPTKVVRSALQNASSIASLLLTLAAAVPGIRGAHSKVGPDLGVGCPEVALSGLVE